MNTRYTFFFSLLLAITVLSSCLDNTQAQLDKLNGEWELESATRAGKPMGLFLKGTYFHFSEGKKLTSTLPYKEDIDLPYTVSFSLEENKITCPDMDGLVFNIDLLEGNKLQLSALLNDSPFVFVLAK